MHKKRIPEFQIPFLCLFIVSNASIIFSIFISSGWLHWVMSFYIRIEPPTDLSVIPDCGNCYFGQCGLTDKCECAPGYSGTECDISRWSYYLLIYLFYLFFLFIFYFFVFLFSLFFITDMSLLLAMMR